MATVQELFQAADNGTLTFEQFQAAAEKAGAKFADLGTGDYVAKGKYDTQVGNRDSQIKTLNETLAQRDADLENIKKQLADAGADQEKLKTLTTQLNTLQTKYDNDTKNYQNQLSTQAYEFAVKEFANTKKFTSKAAMRDFEHALIDKKLQMENGKILGAEDFVTAYSQENEDAFVKEEPKDQQPQTGASQLAKGPSFVQPTSGTNSAPDDKNAPFHFNFSTLRPMDKK